MSSSLLPLVEWTLELGLDIVNGKKKDMLQKARPHDYVIARFYDLSHDNEGAQKLHS